MMFFVIFFLWERRGCTFSVSATGDAMYFFCQRDRKSTKKTAALLHQAVVVYIGSRVLPVMLRIIRFTLPRRK